MNVIENANQAHRPRIVIVGGGFGGAYCAQKLERQLRPHEVEVVLLDRNNYFVFYPLLVEAGTGNLEPRHAVVSIRDFLRRTRFIMAAVTGADVAARRVVFQLPGSHSVETLGYDHLVMAPGSVTRLPDVPGLRQHGLELKSLGDAVLLRDRAIRQLELADAVDDPALRRQLLHFVVVGANFTGVEAAGELQVFLSRACRRYHRLSPQDVGISLIELGQRILPALDRELSDYALRQLVRRGMRVELGTTVVRIEPSRALLDDGRTLATETVVWCAGIAPNPLISRLGLPTDSRGYLLCEPDLRVQGQDRVWAIGDSAVNTDASGSPYPATAQHAVQQGKHLAGNLARVLRGLDSRPCLITSKGALAALGCRTGVARVFGIKLSGFAAWFLWRTVYLLKMPGISRRVRVALDWTMDMIFPTNAVQLDLATRGARREPSALDELAPVTASSSAVESANPPSHPQVTGTGIQH